MNQIQLIVLWLIGIAISSIFSFTGQKLLIHAANNKEVWETGYPLTLMVGTAWTYIIPIIIIGAILIYTVKDLGKKPSSLTKGLHDLLKMISK